MADVKLLPLTEEILTAYAHADIGEFATAYAHATAPLHAEIERLRAERDQISDSNQHQIDCRLAAESQRDMLAEALRTIRNAEQVDPQARQFADEALASASQPPAKEPGDGCG